MELVLWIYPKRSFFIFLSLLLLTAGCLDFGSDTVTENPSPTQLIYCETVMHINEDLAYQPLGLKIIGSGIDDAVWFCFETEETDPSLIFDENFVSPDSLSSGVSIYVPENMPAWWDAKEADLYGGVFSLSAGKHMTVGIDRKENSSTVYVFWNES